MKRTIVILTLTLVVGFALGMVGSDVLYAQQEPVKRTVLIRSELEGIEGKEAVLFLAELAPGGRYETLSPRDRVVLCFGRRVYPRTGREAAGHPESRTSRD